MGEREKQYPGEISYRKLFSLMESKGIKKREHDPNYSLLENVPTKERIELKTNLRPMQSFVFAQN